MTKNHYIYTKLKGENKSNLEGLLRLYENNYIHVMKLFPEIEKSRVYYFYLPEGENNSRVDITISKKSKFTSSIKIKQSSFLNKSLVSTTMEVFVYLDVKLAEVRKFNGKKLFWIRNRYPNKNMFHKDEKYQWNKFFSEWLVFSKNEGLAERIEPFYAHK